MERKSHISDEIRTELAKQSPEIRAGVLAVADRDVTGKPPYITTDPPKAGNEGPAAARRGAPK